VRVIGTCLATGQAAGLAAAVLASGAECDAAAIRAARDTQTGVTFTSLAR